MKKPFFLSLLLFVVLPCSGRADPTVLEVIPLQHRTAAEMVPLVRPFVDKEGAVSGAGGQLIVRSTPANVAQIKKLVQALDVAPKRLVITVRQDADLAGGRQGAQASGSVSAGDARVGLPASGEGTGLSAEVRSGEEALRARVLSTRSLKGEQNTQRIQVLEGSRAFIRVGQSVPIPEQTVVNTPSGVQLLTQGTRYRDVVTGFYVLPRVRGDQVLLEITAQRETPDSQNSGAFDIQKAHTVLSGHLGEWIDLAGVGWVGGDEARGIASHSLTTTVEQRRVWIRVDLAP